MKQAVIAPSMLNLLYPLTGEVDGYPRETFLEDLVNECVTDIRGCFEAGAVRVSIDFTEGRLASNKDPQNPWTGADLLQTFIALNNKVLSKFSKLGSTPAQVVTATVYTAPMLKPQASPFPIPNQRRLFSHPARLGEGQGPLAVATDDCGFSPFSIEAYFLRVCPPDFFPGHLCRFLTDGVFCCFHATRMKARVGRRTFPRR